MGKFNLKKKILILGIFLCSFFLFDNFFAWVDKLEANSEMLGELEGTIYYVNKMNLTKSDASLENKIAILPDYQMQDFYYDINNDSIHFATIERNR